MSTFTSRSLWRFRALAALAIAIVAALVLASPAGAHGGEGQLDITSIAREGDEVTLTAHVIYIADGHGVPDATLTVVVGDGTPVPMAPGAADGDYTATVPAPPGAAIRVTSVEPAVTAETTAPDLPATTTTEATSITEPSSTAAPVTTDQPPSTAPDSDEDAAAISNGASGDNSDDSSTPLIAGLIGLVVVVAGGVAFVVLRKPAPDAS